MPNGKREATSAGRGAVCPICNNFTHLDHHRRRHLGIRRYPVAEVHSCGHNAGQQTNEDEEEEERSGEPLPLELANCGTQTEQAVAGAGRTVRGARGTSAQASVRPWFGACLQSFIFGAFCFRPGSQMQFAFPRSDADRWHQNPSSRATNGIISGTYWLEAPAVSFRAELGTFQVNSMAGRFISPLASSV